MKAILNYDYEWSEKSDDEDKGKFEKGVAYNVIYRQYNDRFVGDEIVVIINRDGYVMSVSSHPDYVTLIEDNQELITKLRYDGIEHVDISKQGEQNMENKATVETTVYACGYCGKLWRKKEDADKVENQSLGSYQNSVVAFSRVLPHR